MSKIGPPKKIYLQIGDHNYDDLESNEVTWCSDRIDNSDLEYNLTLPSPCTVEQWEEITREKFPDDGLVWYLVIKNVEYPYWDTAIYSELDCLDNLLIVQTGQPEPPTTSKPTAQ